MKKKWKLILLIICVSACLLGTVASAKGKDTVLHWYCPYNHEHRQPTVDSTLAIIEHYQGYYVDHRYDDNSSQKVVYLTFDAGYENGNVEKILNILKEEQVPGAFFILAHLIQSEPELVKRMAEEGHVVGNHTYRHKAMVGLRSEEEFLQEVKQLEMLYKETTGYDMSPYFRPPEGTFDESMLKYASSCGYQTVFWSLAYADWDNAKQMNPQKAMDLILKRIHNGAVILLHPTSKTNAEILKPLILELKARGFRFGSLDELTQKEGITPKSGSLF